MELAKLLRKQSTEISQAGLAGWGNTMSDAADEIERLHSEFNKILHHDSCQCAKCRNQI